MNSSSCNTLKAHRPCLEYEVKIDMLRRPERTQSDCYRAGSESEVKSDSCIGQTRSTRFHYLFPAKKSTFTSQPASTSIVQQQSYCPPLLPESSYCPPANSQVYILSSRSPPFLSPDRPLPSKVRNPSPHTATMLTLPQHHGD